MRHSGLVLILLILAGGVLLATGRASGDTVTLVGGDVLNGTVVRETPTAITLAHAVLGGIVIPRAEITSIAYGDVAPQDSPPPPATEAEGSAEVVADAEAPEVEVPELAEEKPEKDWEVNVDFSLTSVTGNTVEQSLRLGVNGNRDTPKTRLRTDMSYFWKSSDNATTDNKFTVGVRHDWLIQDSRWFLFAQGRFDWDQFQSWDQRISASVGPGYHLIQGEKLKLDVFGGLGPRKEFGSSNDDLLWEGSVGTEVVWKLTERMSIDFNLTYFTVVTDSSDWRVRSAGNWRYLLNEEWNLSLLLGYLLEYQTIVDPGDVPDDLRIYAGLQMGF